MCIKYNKARQKLFQVFELELASRKWVPKLLYILLYNYKENTFWIQQFTGRESIFYSILLKVKKDNGAKFTLVGKIELTRPLSCFINWNWILKTVMKACIARRAVEIICRTTSDCEKLYFFFYVHIVLWLKIL